MKKSLKFWSIFPALLIISGVLLQIFRVMIKRKKDSETTEPGPITDESEEVEEEEEPYNKEQSIINHYAIVRKNLPDSYSDNIAKVITAQAIHETNFFTSRLYREQNNLFGMRQPIARETLSTGSNNGWATFASPDQSVQDLVLYFKEFKIDPSKMKAEQPKLLVNQYVKTIKNSGYFTEEFLPYMNAVYSHYKTVQNLIQ